MRLATPVLSVTALLAVFCIGTTATAVASSSRAARGASLAGTWSGHYSGAVSGTFKLHWTQSNSKLSGTIKLSRPSGTYGISGSVRGKAIKFGAVGVGATYTGKVSGKSMSGTWKSPSGGGTWSARKTS
jgi:hypothetical protein